MIHTILAKYDTESESSLVSARYFQTDAMTLCYKHFPSGIKLMDSNDGFDLYCVRLSVF